MRVKGLPFKELKEAFIKLRASFQYKSRKLEETRQQRQDMVKEANKQNRVIKSLKDQIASLKSKNRESIKSIKSEYKSEINQLNKTIKSLEDKIVSTQSLLDDTRSRSANKSQTIYLLNKRIGGLTDKIKDKTYEISKYRKRVNRLSDRKQPRVVFKTKTVKERVPVQKIVKEPLPGKIRQLMSSNTITQGRMDLTLIAITFLRISDETKLSLRQIVLLLEAYNLTYFTYGKVLTTSRTTFRELEYKGLIKGDREGKKLAIGWFITKAGKYHAEKIIKRVYDNNIKKEYLEHDN